MRPGAAYPRMDASCLTDPVNFWSDSAGNVRATSRSIPEPRLLLPFRHNMPPPFARFAPHLFIVLLFNGYHGRTRSRALLLRASIFFSYRYIIKFVVNVSSRFRSKIKGGAAATTTLGEGEVASRASVPPPRCPPKFVSSTQPFRGYERRTN